MHAIEQTYTSLLTDVGLSTRVPSIRRSAYEGLTWCIVDAPQLEKELLSYVEHGSDFSGTWPRWLTPLRDRFIRDNNPLDLKALRQLLLFCYKAEHTHDNDTNKTFATSWVDVQRDVAAYSLDSIPDRWQSVLLRARTHCTSCLGLTAWDKIIPYHGPGAVYDRQPNKGKWSKWFTTIENCYPYAQYCYLSNPEHWMQNPLGPDEIDDCIVARLSLVPKDARGPRLICVHPSESVWIQEGLRDRLESAILRRRPSGWAWPLGQIHFDDQTVNGEAALKASLDRRHATLDLKEASDRLSVSLVRFLFGSHYRWFDSCRAQKVCVPLLSKVVDVGCYAPMGNATTFPVQSLVFWAVCVATLETVHSTDRVLVFGDDIVVPSAYFSLITEALEAFGLVVNHSKSFYKGAFRESCGVDAYNGVDVTPVRWKTTYDPLSVSGIMAISTIAQKLRQGGHHESSSELYGLIRDRLKGCHGKSLPCTNNPDHGGIAEYCTSDSSAWNEAYWHRDLQKYVTSVLRLRERTIAHPHGWNHVLSSLTSLERTGRSNDPAKAPSRGLQLDRGWTDVL
jgi:hypothetical protein